MGKFKDLVLGNKKKERLDEAVGGVVSTPAINSGYGTTSQRTGKQAQGDSRIDTGGKFTFDASELPDSDFSRTTNPREAFQEQEQLDSVVLHEDEDGSITLSESDDGRFEVVIRDGSDEKTYSLDEDAAKKVRAFFA